MSCNVSIRKFKPGDLDAVLDIAVAAWSPIFDYVRETLGERLMRAEFPDWQRQKKKTVKDACELDNRAFVFVVEEGKEIIGFITLYTDDDSLVGRIGNNAVHPGWQGKGVGGTMYQYAFSFLKEKGMKFVKVYTGGDPAHAPARRAYEKAGFSTRLPHVEYYREL